MRYYKIKKIFFLIVVLFFYNCSDQGTIHIAGDLSHVGAKVYVDEVYKGKLKKLKSGSITSIEVQNGLRRIVIVQRDSVIFEEIMTLKAEYYIGL